MSIIKSSLDGIGTGAGVAWPLFGILSSTLGLVAGSSVALVTGSAASILFCFVSGVIFLMSYQNTIKKEASLQTKINNAQKDLHMLINDYLRNIFITYQFYSKKNKSKPTEKEAIQFITKQIDLDLTFCKDDFQMNLRSLLIHVREKVPFVLDSHDQLDLKIKALTISETILPFSATAISRKSMLQSAFIGAMGSFGAVAGCSAGFMGLLSGVGLLSGFAAIPIMGWVTLGLALTMALVVGYNSSRHAECRSQLKVVKQKTLSLYTDLNKFNISREIKIQAAQMAEDQPKENRASIPLFRTVPAQSREIGVQTEQVLEDGAEEVTIASVTSRACSPSSR